MAIVGVRLNDAVLIRIDSSAVTEVDATKPDTAGKTGPTRAVHWSSDDSEAVLFVVQSLLLEMNGQVVMQDTGGKRKTPLIRVPMCSKDHVRMCCG